MKRITDSRHCRGFTLVEMLVTLALMAMISALLWQALHQVSRVEQVLQQSGVEGQLDVARREWLRGLIQATLVERSSGPRQLQGDAGQLVLTSAESVNLPGLQADRLQIRFETDSRSGRQRLLVSAAPALDSFQTESQAPPVELLAWEGKPGTLQFMGADGQWQDRWPLATASVVVQDEADMLRAAQAARPRLPKAVLLDLGADAGGPLIVSLSVTEPARLSRADWEAQ